jgi:GNAT superfamily N-acetyltransferase
MNDRRIDVSVEVISVENLNGYGHEIARVHAAAFGTGEKGVIRYERESLPEMTCMPGFVAAIARRDDEIVGFACGHDAATHQPWAIRVFAALVSAGYDAWTDDTFEFADIAVRPEWQGQGIGRLLLDAVTARVSRRYCVLVTYNGPHAAKRLYLRAGWVTFVDDFRYRTGSPFTSILGLELPARLDD